MDIGYPDSVVEIWTEGSGFDHFLQILSGSADNAGVDLFGRKGTNGGYSFIL